MQKNKQEHVMVGYSTHIMVWLALLILTGLTITVTGLNLRSVSIVIAIFIAAFKSSLVINYFMHIKFEDSLFKIMIFVAIFTLAIIIGLTFLDISYR